MVIWLGETAQDEDGERIREAISMDPPGMEPHNLLELQWRNSLDHFENEWGYECDPANRASILSSLIRRPSFFRRWCCPEAIHTWHIAQLMLIGGTILRTLDVRHTTSRLLHRENINTLDPRDLKRVDALNEREKQTLRFLMQECDTAECSLEHDRVYAFLGLAKDAPVYELEVDYTQSMVDMCRDIMRGAISPENKEESHAFQLIVIAASRPRNDQISPSELPSWIPAWHASVSFTSEEHRHITEAYAYPRYQVPPSHLRVEGDYAFMNGGLVQPYFPPQHNVRSGNKPTMCPCCTYWEPEWHKWTDQLRSVLCNARERGQLLFTPSFQRLEEFSRSFDAEITFILTKARGSPKGGQQQVYQLHSYFDSTRRSDSPVLQESVWVCIG